MFRPDVVVMRHQVLEVWLAAVVEVAEPYAGDVRRCRVAGAAARIVAALTQNIQQFADVREVGHQLPARERRRQAKLSSMVRVVDAAEQGAGSAAGAMQELPKHVVQTTEDVVQFDQGRERIARPMLPIRRGVRCTR